jgi:hypothetical protein
MNSWKTSAVIDPQKGMSTYNQTHFKASPLPVSINMVIFTQRPNAGFIEPPASSLENSITHT